MKKILIFISFFVSNFLFSQDNETQPTLENIQTFVGKTITICEKVTGVHETAGENALLNFGKPFPKNAFTIIVFKLDRDQFSYNPLDLKGKTICVSGEVILYKGKPEIIVKKESDIEIK